MRHDSINDDHVSFTKKQQNICMVYSNIDNEISGIVLFSKQQQQQHQQLQQMPAGILAT